jgi:phosphomannomutase
LALIADEVLSEIKNKKNQIVVVNDATSWLVKEIVEKNNVKYEEVEVGEINVVEKMLGYESIIGGEGSNGGVIITPSRCRDGILTLLYILKIMAKKKKSLKGLINELPKYYYLKEKIKLKKDFFSSREKIEKYYLDNGYSLQETGDKTGGLKAIKNGSWVWFRQSKTEDKVLRVIADSKDEKIAKKLIEEGRSVLKKYKIL